ENARNLHRPRQRYGVQASRAPGRNQREFARVVTTLDRDVAQRAFHVGRHDIEHTLSSTDRAYFSLHGSAHFRGEHFESCPRPPFIELEFAAQQRSARKVTEYHVRIGNRWEKRLAITGRTGIGAGRFRTHPQRSTFIDARNRSTDGAD